MKLFSGRRGGAGPDACRCYRHICGGDIPPAPAAVGPGVDMAKIMRRNNLEVLCWPRTALEAGRIRLPTVRRPSAAVHARRPEARSRADAQ
ncbi:hypothetical protein EVAR_58096_1 [Eumeta japonica]|uniref:Uncharacterized protein n=1 Tax=Eumeta variegata TaxID=151549 RepID=A0A4C1YN87_EUMVA|nr:hypothetical protein EVAR_58096_1 [Eumeta japonica]